MRFLMKKDIILAGVGGQGILSIAYVIDNAALACGYNFKQAEVHGMAQRGGAVQSHLRISDTVIHSDLVPLGCADLIISVEPLETLRYLSYLSEAVGVVIASTTPYVNIPDYPYKDTIVHALGKLPEFVLVDSESLAKDAGSVRSQNMVMVGASYPYLSPISRNSLEKFISILFQSKGEKVMNVNLTAFEMGYVSGKNFRLLVKCGMETKNALLLNRNLEAKEMSTETAELWKNEFERSENIRSKLEALVERMPVTRDALNVFIDK
jgi:indolepyruvate ferredoxin oxidoreductase beta subunit